MLNLRRNIIHAVSIVITAIMAACVGNDEPALVYGGDILLLTKVSDMQMSVESRTNTIDALLPETIGVYADINGIDMNVFSNQCMYYKWGKEIDKSGLDKSKWPSDNDWVYAPTKSWIADKNYTFYGYSPYNSENVEMKMTGKNERTFCFHDIPPLSATEYLVGNGEVVVESGTRPKLQLAHITSRLRFMFAIGEQYNQLRDIKVKSIKISDSGNNTPFWECTVLIGPEVTTQIDVFRGTKIYKSNKDIELIPEGETPHLLTTDYTSFSSAYNLLGKIANTTLTVTYDVYDKKDQLLRENQTAKNVIDLSQWDFERGKCYDVRIMVSPKYLYVLSDNDVAPDGLIDVTDPTLPTP